MECQNVDRTAIAKVVEGELGFDDPTDPAKRRDHLVDECGVSTIDQPVTFAAPPAGIQKHRDPEHRRHASQLREPDRLQPTQLEVRHDLLADTSLARHVHLSEPEVLTDRSEKAPDTEVIHAEDVVDRRLPAAYVVIRG